MWRLLSAWAICIGCLIGAVDAQDCVPSTSAPELDVNAGGLARYYVDLECFQPDCPDVLSIWVYEETNQIEGLQRDDILVDDTCGGAIRSDTYSLPV